MSSPSRKLHHPSMRMTIEEREEPLWKGFKMKRETKKPLPRAFVGWYIFVFTHKRSSAEIHRVFLFPRMIEHLSRLPTLMRYKHLAGGLESISRHETEVLDTERDRWDSREGGGLALNMYWLWIEVKCRDPGCRHDRGFSAPCLGRILASITRSSSSSRRASEELSRQQHEIKHRRSYLGSTRSSIPAPSSTREPVQGFLQAGCCLQVQACNLLICHNTKNTISIVVHRCCHHFCLISLLIYQHEKQDFHRCSSQLPLLFYQPVGQLVCGTVGQCKAPCVNVERFFILQD